MLFSSFPSLTVGPFVAGGSALLAALGLTPLIRRLARRAGWVDRPSADRWRERPVALMGGAAVALAVGVGVLLSGGHSAYGWPVWTGSGLMFTAGLIDDLWGVRADGKVLAQIVATVLLLYAGHAFWPGGPAWVSLPVTFLWVIGVTNAVNLIDGVDGLAGGIAAVAGVTLAIISASQGQLGLAVLTAALAGASLGFLAYNRAPASIFLGDCGSLFLGYVLAVAALGAQSSGGPIVGTLVPIAVLAVPIADTTFVTLTRLLRGEPVSEGGTDHVHHRLIRIGLSERRAVAGLWAASATFGGAALAAALWMPAALVVSIAGFGLVGVTVVGVHLVSSEEEGGLGREPAISERVGTFMRLFAGGAAWKSVAAVFADLVVVGAAFVVAIHLRYGGALSPEVGELMLWALPGLPGLKLLVFYAFGLYEGIWRHAGTPEVIRVAGASAVASLVTGMALFLVADPVGGVVSIFVLDWGVATAGVGGVRFGFRALRQYVAARREGGRPVLVYGSGPRAMLLLRYLRHHPAGERSVVGLLDAESERQGRRVQGVEVVGGPDELSALASTLEVEEVIVPAGAADEPVRRRLRSACEELDVSYHRFQMGLETPSEPAQENGRVEGALDHGTFRRLVASHARRVGTRSPRSSFVLLIQLYGTAPLRRPEGPSWEELTSRFAEVVDTTLRASDYFTVWSDDLFSVLLTQTSEEGAHHAANRLGQRFKEVLDDVPAGRPQVDYAVEPVHPDLDLNAILDRFLTAPLDEPAQARTAGHEGDGDRRDSSSLSSQRSTPCKRVSFRSIFPF